MTMTETLAPPVVDTTNGDHDLFAHYVIKGQDMVGYIYGQPVRALCGKTWVPSKDPIGYPICATCREIKDQMIRKGSNG